jgi:uncharacterized protein
VRGVAMPAYIMAIIIVAVLIGAYGITGYVFANLLLYPKRQPVVKSPGEYGLLYENVDFKSTDGLGLKGWFIPGNLEKTVIVTHPMFCNRHGFLKRNQSRLTSIKTDIRLLESIKAINQAGYSVLTFDFRNHGESEKGITGVGLNEFQDVIGAMDYLKTRPDSETNEIAFVSFCMGANSTIIAMSKAKERFANVKCLIAFQPISFSIFVRSYLKANYTKLGLVLLPLIKRICIWRGGYPLEEITPEGFVRDITVPVLYVQGKTDPWTETTDIQSFFNKTPGTKELLWLDDKMSRPESYNYFGKHPEKMVAFLQKYF